jgi:hypothetical protein
MESILFFTGGTLLGIFVGVNLAAHHWRKIVHRYQRELAKQVDQTKFWNRQYCYLVRRLDEQDTNPYPDYYPEEN